jgi:predicted secreted protein
MPCPELLYLGLDREVDQRTSHTVESEDTRVAKRMREEQSKFLCQSMVDCIVYQVEEYMKHGFTIVGLIGINGSPTCGINTTWADDQEFEGRGIFIEILEKALKDKGIFIHMVGITARDPKHAVAALERLFQPYIL